MTASEQIDHLGADLDALVNRYADEYDLPYAAVIGVLQLKIHCLCCQVAEESDEEDGLKVS